MHSGGLVRNDTAMERIAEGVSSLQGGGVGGQVRGQARPSDTPLCMCTQGLRAGPAASARASRGTLDPTCALLAAFPIGALLAGAT